MLNPAMRLAVAVVGLAIMAVPVMPAQKTNNINVTTTIYDNDSAGSQLLTRSDDYNGFQQASYSTVGSGARKELTSVILSGDGWQVYLGNQSLRTVWLTLSKPVNGSPVAPVSDGFYYANVEVYSRCFDTSNHVIGFQAIPPGMASSRCSFGVDFSSGSSAKYKLVMSPTTSGTGWATVSCNSGSGNACMSWTIVPNSVAGGGNVPTVANLFKFAKNGNLIYIGSYYNTFRVDVTNP